MSNYKEHIFGLRAQLDSYGEACGLTPTATVLRNLLTVLHAEAHVEAWADLDTIASRFIPGVFYDGKTIAARIKDPTSPDAEQSAVVKRLNCSFQQMVENNESSAEIYKRGYDNGVRDGRMRAGKTKVIDLRVEIGDTVTVTPLL